MNTGIYKITNKINNKFYYGSTMNNFSTRWRGHKTKLNKNTHHNIHLQAAWNKYGASAFEFSIILKCMPDECLIHEQRYLDLYWDNGLNCYNRSPTAKNTFGVKKTSEAREKIRNRMLGNQINIGRIPTNITREKMSRAKRGVKKRINTSGYVGVTLCKQTKTWAAEIKRYGKKIWLGRFITAIEASKAYQDKLAELCKTD